jgi:hypothetical protein
MLLGYDNVGEIKFVFSDEKYLDLKYPNDTAKISNFWGDNNGLMEFFISIKAFKDWKNIKNYKIVNNKLTKKSEEELKKNKNTISVEPNTLTIENDAKLSNMSSMGIIKIDKKENKNVN